MSASKQYDEKPEALAAIKRRHLDKTNHSESCATLIICSSHLNKPPLWESVCSHHNNHYYYYDHYCLWLRGRWL